MNEIESVRIRELREIISQAYKEYFEKGDGYCKPSEGNITITYNFGNYFDDDYLNKQPEIDLEIYSYIFSDDGRRKNWIGKDLKILLESAIDFFKKCRIDQDNK